MRVTATGGTPVAVTRLAPGAREPSLAAVSARWAPFPLFVGFGSSDTQGVYVGTLDGWRADARARGSDGGRVCAARLAAAGCTTGCSSRSASTRRARWSAASRSPWPRPSDRTSRCTRGTFAVSATGVLAHRTGRGERRQLAWVDRAGVTAGHRWAARRERAQQSGTGARWPARRGDTAPCKGIRTCG